MTRLGLVLIAGFAANMVLANAPDLSTRPAPRPAQTKPVKQRQPVVIKAAKPGSAPGQVCGDPALQGINMAPVPAELPGCGIAQPVLLSDVSGLGLTQPALVNCTTAKALKLWVEKGVKPTVGTRGGGAQGLHVAAHYSCRTRNNKPGAKISEHGRGNAIDIAAVLLKNGDRLTVLDGWKDPKTAPVLKALHKSACGPFGTVLGPQADRYHQDHFHLDVAQRRNPYCR
jgi:hypothetical protein